jgi:hypothetical protein
MMLRVTHYNGLYEIAEHKYKDLSQIRDEYPYIVKTFRDAHFPRELESGLSSVLDDLGTTPLVVRSSSLLEDRFGITFSGKYASFFLANQGSRRQRLDALIEAVAGVYASTFAPEPISYRSQLGLLDFSEEMGIMIQEAIGREFNGHYLPLFSGMACTNGKGKRKSVLLKIIPGFKLGALDTDSSSIVEIPLHDTQLDFDQLSQSIAQQLPDTIDVLNLKTGRLETASYRGFLSDHGSEFIGVRSGDSSVSDRSVPEGKEHGEVKQDSLRLFADSISRGPFPKLLSGAIRELSLATSTNVRVQFASDGESLFLLQCKTSC